MSRHIDADEITKEKLIEFVGCQDSISFDDLLWMIKDYIPTADVVEVVHGEWISLEPEIGLFACSKCEHKILREECNYCPNCGARMDGKKVE